MPISAGKSENRKQREGDPPSHIFYAAPSDVMVASLPIRAAQRLPAARPCSTLGRERPSGEVGRQRGRSSMSAEVNKAIARRFLEAQAKGDLDTLDELMAPDFVDRSLLPGQEPDRESYKQSVVEMLSAFPNTSFTVEEQIAEGNVVASRYTGTSIHQGE